MTPELPDPLPVTSVGWTMSTVDGTSAKLATVALDVAGRPDVADLARVHATEGVGEIRTLATPEAGGAVRFDVVILSPVRCHLAFVVGTEDLPILRDAARDELLVLATGDPATTGALWLAINIDGDALTRLLVP